MLERSVLENKDREQLVAIAQALGVKSTSRAKKADLIVKILESTGVTGPGSSALSGPVRSNGTPTASQAIAAAILADAVGEAAATPEHAEPHVNGETRLFDINASDASVVSASRPEPQVKTVSAGTKATESAAPPSSPIVSSAPRGAVRSTPPAPQRPEQPAIILGPDGEPLAEWEIELLGDEGPAIAVKNGELATSDSPGDADVADGGDAQTGEGEGETRRRRRRRRGRNRDGEVELSPQPADRQDRVVVDRQEQRADRPERAERQDRPEPRDRSDRPDRPDRADRPERQDRYDRQGADRTDTAASEPIEVSGYLDLRDEGYGFLRVNGYLATKDDAYVNVKQTRQYGLRKGDFVTGTMRAAGRNEKNAALLEIHTVNGQDPEQARNRRRFEDLTPLFPDKRLLLSNPNDPSDMTARIIDLISPIGKGQRGIIVSPPKAGKTTIMKTIATAIERNNPEVKLIVLLIDERPEEVTDMRRTVKGEVISSTFDRPSEEHTHVAELAIEKAKRLVEAGEDVVIILDGITRLARAYNLAAPATGRVMSGGIDAGALYPPKKFFGAARNVEEGGSLTILATALVETNSRMDDAIFEEFKGTGNMELRLDRKLAERRVYPAIDVDASSTRHEELLFDRRQLQMVWRLRRVLSGLAADGNAAPGLELLIDRLKTFRTNDEFLAEISKQPL